ncbi:hypothetical protein Hesp01_44060 [Herbidospora sp. NBRC 101105]|nr:hypothetical protein Hesp01_44060 [Herbidospora sp. NBRC 101105]
MDVRPVAVVVVHDQPEGEAAATERPDHLPADLLPPALGHHDGGVEVAGQLPPSPGEQAGQRRTIDMREAGRGGHPVEPGRGKPVQPVEARDGGFGFGAVGGLGRQGDPEPVFADGGGVSPRRDTHLMEVVSSFPTIMFSIIT